MEDNVIGWRASGKAGAVAAGESEAVAAGIHLLERGGNAADAAAATLFALTVTDYGSCAIGGEIPLIIYEANRQEVKVLCGMGRAPLGERWVDWPRYLEYFQQAGYEGYFAVEREVDDEPVGDVKQAVEFLRGRWLV